MMGRQNKESPSPPYVDIISQINNHVHSKNTQNFLLYHVHNLLSMSMDKIPRTRYNNTINKRDTEQQRWMGVPKGKARVQGKSGEG